MRRATWLGRTLPALLALLAPAAGELRFGWLQSASAGRRAAAGALDALARDLSGLAAPGQIGQDVALVLSSLLGGLRSQQLLVGGSYDGGQRRLELRLNGRGAEGVIQRDTFVWFRWHVKRRLVLTWKVVRQSVLVEFAGLSIGPLPENSDFYRRAGLDDFACPRWERAGQRDYQACHLRKAIILEELWNSNRTVLPENLQHYFGWLDNQPPVLKGLAKQLGHGFGWSMLLILSAPPSVVECLEFDEAGVAARTKLDAELDPEGAELAARHGFKALSLEIARPLLGDSPLGGLVRTLGERLIPFVVHMGLLASVGEPRWRGRGLRGADPAVVAQLVGASAQVIVSTTRPSQAPWRQGASRRGLMSWRQRPARLARGQRPESGALVLVGDGARRSRAEWLRLPSRVLLAWPVAVALCCSALAAAAAGLRRGGRAALARGC